MHNEKSSVYSQRSTTIFIDAIVLQIFIDAILTEVETKNYSFNDQFSNKNEAFL